MTRQRGVGRREPPAPDPRGRQIGALGGKGLGVERQATAMGQGARAGKPRRAAG